LGKILYGLIRGFDKTNLLVVNYSTLLDGRVEVLEKGLMETKLLTVIEAAQYLKMGRSTVYKLAQEGKLPKDKVGRQWRFDAKELDKTLKEEDLLRLLGSFPKGSYAGRNEETRILCGSI